MGKPVKKDDGSGIAGTGICPSYEYEVKDLICAKLDTMLFSEENAGKPTAVACNNGG